MPSCSSSSSSSTLPLTTAPMDSIFAISSFVSHHLTRISSDLSSRFDATRRFAMRSLPFSSVSLRDGAHAFFVPLSADHVARTLAGTSVYTVSTAGYEFVLTSDPNNDMRSLGLLCFRHEDAQSLLHQVKLRQPVLWRGARVVLITLDQVFLFNS